MLEKKQKQIGDTTYEVTQMPSTPARKLLARLIKVGGPALAALADGYNGKIADVGGKTIGEAITAFATSLTEDDLEYVVKQSIGGGLVAYCTDGTKWPVLTGEVAELHFAGKTHELLRLVGFVLEVNFSGFFGDSGIAGVLGRAKVPPASTPSNSPAT